MTSDFFLPLEAARPGVAILRDREAGWKLFTDPVQVVQAVRLDDVEQIVAQTEAWSESGGYAVGFLAYEAAPAFDRNIQVRTPTWPMLAWFALYSNPPVLYRELEPVSLGSPATLDLAPDSQKDYQQMFGETKRALAEGEIYQANLTFKLGVQAQEDPIRLFGSLCGVNPPPYATYIHGRDWQVVSLSPELLFERNGNRVQMRPMKGTATYDGSPSAKERAIQGLRSDPKTMAENIMIVDMVRNDLGRIAETGSIQTTSLLTVEEHRTVLQVTSTVTAEVDELTLEIFRNVFPPASVTGAPKVSACRHIAKLEAGPRGIYCGAIGTMEPNRKATFSVGIRTALFKGAGRSGEYGVGSGVVWDSDVDSEFQECLAKAAVLTSAAPEWALLESMPDTLAPNSPQLAKHLERLQRSAEAFEIPFDRERILSALALPRGARNDGIGKLRLTLNRRGEANVEQTLSALQDRRLTAKLASRPIQTTDPRMRHKTTDRSLFNDLRSKFPTFDEVLLFNELGQAVCFTNGNLIAEIDGRWLSPEPDSGCLAGIGLWRFMLESEVRLCRIPVQDLREANRILLSNAVVGTREVQMFWD